MTKAPKDGSDEGRYTDKHRSKVLEELQKDGVILELQTYRRFLENEWYTKLNPKFARIDRNLSGKERVERFGALLSRRDDSELGEIDIVAEKDCHTHYDPFSLSYLTLVVECKSRLDMNWVLFMEANELFSDESARYDRFSMYESSVFSYLHRVYGEEFDFWGKEIHQAFGGVSHHCNSKLPAIAQSGWGLFKNRSSLIDAVRHVLDAFDYNVIRRIFHTEWNLSDFRKGKRNLTHWRAYPVVVFDGSLWSLTFKKENPVLEPIDFGVMEIIHHNEGYYVDIVRWDAFDKYLKLVQKETDEIEAIRC